MFTSYYDDLLCRILLCIGIYTLRSTSYINTGYDEVRGTHAYAGGNVREHGGACWARGANGGAQGAPHSWWWGLLFGAEGQAAQRLRTVATERVPAVRDMPERARQPRGAASHMSAGGGGGRRRAGAPSGGSAGTGPGTNPGRQSQTPRRGARIRSLIDRRHKRFPNNVACRHLWGPRASAASASRGSLGGRARRERENGPAGCAGLGISPGASRREYAAAIGSDATSFHLREDGWKSL